MVFFELVGLKEVSATMVRNVALMNIFEDWRLRYNFA